jgi:drug/metabolite transporter (DMT)-like permease
MLLLGAAGITHFVIGRIFNWHAIRIIGAARASQITKTELVFAMFLGFILLSEPISMSKLLGAAVIFTGTLIITRSQVKGALTPDVSFENFGRGVLFGLGAAVAWGSSPILVREGVRSLGSPIAGTMISGIFAVVCFITLLGARRKLLGIRNIPKAAIPPIMILGIMSSIANVSRYIALELVPVTIFAPILGTAPLFTLILSYIFMKRTELLNLRVGVAAAFTIGGTYILLLV